MNESYYYNQTFPGTELTNNTVPNQQTIQGYEINQKDNLMYNNIPIEQSYIENILRLNRGKLAKFHITIPGSIEWQDKFEEPINYNKEFYITNNSWKQTFFLI